MNEKTAKRLRQLTRHLQTKGAVANTWTQYANDVQTKYEDKEKIVGKNKEGQPIVEKFQVRTLTTDINSIFLTTSPVRLDPTCGRSVYQHMKKNQSARHAG